MLASLLGRKANAAIAADMQAGTPQICIAASQPSFVDLKVRLHQQLIDILDLPVVERTPREQLEQEVGGIIREMLKREAGFQFSEQDRRQLIADVLDELLGFGALEPLLKDPTVNDIIVNTYGQVCVERCGKIEVTTVHFKDDAHLLRIINKMVAEVGRRIDESQPIVDARLKDGSRINAVISPVAVDGPLLSIRKFAKEPFDLARLIATGSITPEVSSVLDAMVRGKLNILISGGTGSGKTTLLNAMSGCIHHSEAIVTIEDAAELQLQQPMVRRMETRPPNVEGRGEITQRDLVKAALRMRPDRIILGEVRAGEAFDMLQAMNTGHEGSMSTIHANSPRDALSRLEQMIGMAGFDMAPRTVRQQIASAIHIVLQLTRGSDGRRRVISVQEVTGMEGEVISMNEIFRFRRTSTDADGNIHGFFESTGIRPKFAEELDSLNVSIPTDLFAPHRRLE
ncbi:type II/IV secretion system-related protein [Aliidongia dinghuensis]|uniref:Type II/IV secretion system-related protein n=1 Tax=Aliidongia dinghuensis TaxID=1867774 RepID=A0A8J3E2X0_9PROT|nr:CpaF family protein [Aliidongia dinghuensis]GGF14319.1 type II/IV secretion system-related protein [Aliidongia dinghuensis]